MRIAGKLLRTGEVVAIPTETVYGLAANALDGEAVKKIFAAKGRPQDNPLIVHLAGFDEVGALTSLVPESARRLAEKFWPGPLTVILPKSDKIPDEVTAGLDTVALRCPSHPAARAVIAAAGVPLAAPSANISGGPSPTGAEHVLRDLGGKIPLILDGGRCEVGVESTVVTLTTEIPRLLRPGGVTLEQLRQVLGDVEVDEAVLHRMKAGEAASSPGMKYKHYAPKAELTLVRGGFEDFIDYVEKQGDCFVLCFEGEEKYFKNAVTYGRRDDGESKANRLFGALRELDERGAGAVLVRDPGTAGIDLAVCNRLLRASAFRTVDLRSAGRKGRAKMPVIGVTGPTGAGKSTLARLLAERGCALIDADALAHGVYPKGSAVLGELVGVFGPGILSPDGELNRPALAAAAFSSRENTERLNAIVHPAVTKEVRRILKEHEKRGARAAVLDAAALFESGEDALCDLTAAVTAPEDVRKERIRKRDGLSEKQAESRMSVQRENGYYSGRADLTVENRLLCDLKEAAEKISRWIDKKRTEN